MFKAMNMVVRDLNDSDKRFYSKKLTINEEYFMRLINSSVTAKYNNSKLLDIADRIMPAL